MVVELRAKSQITIPKTIISSLNLSEGDKFEVFERDGMICFVPVTVYPKQYLDELRNEVDQVKQNLREGKQPTFDSVDALLESLNSNHDPTTNLHQ